ncbi:MAG: dTMP kinase [Proteobacteria bacterium]|nr:dTMP kinase [Pseudomonadota bacterium]
MAGRLITLEGGEGVGKSSLAKKLASWLRSKGINVVETREPGGTLISDQIRALFKSPPEGEELKSETEALLVSAARMQHVTHLISPALKADSWVICDRFADSTRVYQGLLGGVPLNDLEWLIKFSTAGIEPSLTFLLDCDVDVSRSRIAKSSGNRDDASRYDQAHQTVHERLRKGFRQLAGFYPSRFYILDASEPKDAIFAAAVAELESRFFKDISSHG